MANVHRDTVVRQFSQQAEAFAACPAHADDRSLSVFLAFGAFASSSRILDSGCGPGIVSCYLARHVGHVTGVDVTPAMLALARARATEEQLDNVRFLEGDVTRLPLDDGEFDGAVSRYTFHHLEAPVAALREMIRVTRPGGTIVVLDVAPEARAREAYDGFERTRDPSHTTALTLEEWLTLGELVQLRPALVERFPVPMTADALLEHAYPEQVRREDLRRMLQEDVGVDRLGFGATADGDTVTIHFPLLAIAWRVPGA